MNGYADDLAAVIEALDLKDAVLVGHSTGGGEVARYIGRHGTKRVAKAVLIAALPPIMLKTSANPEGLPMEVFDGLRRKTSNLLATGWAITWRSPNMAKSPKMTMTQAVVTSFAPLGASQAAAGGSKERAAYNPGPDIH